MTHEDEQPRPPVTFEAALACVLARYAPLVRQRSHLTGLPLEETEQLARIVCYETWLGYDGDLETVEAVFPGAFVLQTQAEVRRQAPLHVSDYRRGQMEAGEISPGEAVSILEALGPVLPLHSSTDSDGTPVHIEDLMRSNQHPDLVVEGARALVERARGALREEEDLVVRIHWLGQYRGSSDSLVAEKVEEETGRACSRSTVARWRSSALEAMRVELGVTA